MKNPFSELNKKEWTIFLGSLISVVAANFIGDFNVLNLISSILGVTFLIFVAKGSVWGQIFTLAFAVFYVIKSYVFKYYGEVLISFLMMIPLAVFSIVTWYRNPYKKGENVVRICRISFKEICFSVLCACAVTVAFYFILKALGTANLIVSTISVFTSFLASYLMLRRNSFYAVMFMLNDLVLIVLWGMSCAVDIANVSIVVCFFIFLINDTYGFIRWKMREKEQNA